MRYIFSKSTNRKTLWKSRLRHLAESGITLKAVALFLFSGILCLSLLTETGCKKQKRDHEAGQRASVQEREDQNRNLIAQVVLAAEELEKHPDPAFLRNSIGRLNSWLQKRPPSKDFQKDEELVLWKQNCDEFEAALKTVMTLYPLFLDNSDTVPTEEQADQLLNALDELSAKAQPLLPLGDWALDGFIKMTKELKEKLNSSLEFKFSDKVESFQNAIRSFQIPDEYQFDRMRQAIYDFGQLLTTDQRTFTSSDADYLKQAVWFRNIASWAKGTSQNDLDIIINLFDWSVENIVLDESSTENRIHQHPWQTILLGHGTALERAIVFMELLRQQRIDSFILQPASEVPDDFPLLVGVCCEGQVLLFLPQLGLPIPSGDGLQLDKGLKFTKPATLGEAAADDSLLRRLDLSEEQRFPLTSEQLQELIPLVPTNPFVLSERMIQMEQEFSGNVYTVLATSYATWMDHTKNLHLNESKHITAFRHLTYEYISILEQLIIPAESDNMIAPYLFMMKEGGNLEPYIGAAALETNDSGNEGNQKDMLRDNTVLKAPLWIGKILYFKGNLTKENGAAYWFLQGRISERLLKDEASHLPEKLLAMQQEYQNAYMEQNNVACPEEQLQQVVMEMLRQEQQSLMMKYYIKETATFYLSLVSHAAGNYDTALTYLQTPELFAEESLWREGARYLLARWTEEKEDYKTAMGIYKSCAGQYSYGALLRGKWLSELAAQP